MKLDPQCSGIELPSGTSLLRGQYEIERPLSQGGFGITYLARDSLKRRVVVKECFPQDLCTRAALRVCAKSEQFAKRFQTVLQNFKEEAYRLAALDHTGIVRVHQVFEENGTAFLAMDFVNGEDLCTIVEEHPERLDAGALSQIVVGALEAVQYTHEEGVLHRDLAPDNFIIDARNRVTLIDFGSSLEIDRQTETASSKLLAVKDGYSPHEFYLEGAHHDVPSDIYALGATFHYLVTGYTPPDAGIRVQELQAQRPDPYEPLREVDWDLDQHFLDLINTALNLHPDHRIASAAAWLDALQDAPAPVAQPEAQHAPQPQQQAQPEVAVHVEAPNSQAKHGPTKAPDPRIAAEEEVVYDSGPKQKTLSAAPPPDPTAIPLDAPEIVAKISELVTDTNSKFDPGLPQLLKQGDTVVRTEKPEVKEAPKPKGQPVDIFGNPIEDVEAFLAEQDGTPLKRKKKKKGGSDDSTEFSSGNTATDDPSIEEQRDATAQNGKAARKGAMGRFFNKILSSKDTGDSVVLQN